MTGGLLVITGCQTVPITGRKGLDLISADQEIQLGLSSFQEIKSNTPVSHDAAANEMVKRVGEKIARVAGKDMPNAQWEFVVFDSKEANAFCLPGGKIGVYTGILPIVKDDAGLATVLGHGVAHATLQHGRVLSAVYRVSPPSGSQPQGLALRLMVEPRHHVAVEQTRATA